MKIGQKTKKLYANKNYGHEMYNFVSHWTILRDIYQLHKKIKNKNASVSYNPKIKSCDIDFLF